MGFLDGLCDYNGDEEQVSWHSFWRLEGQCSIVTLGAAVPCITALLTCLALLIQWVRSTSSSGSLNGDKTPGNRPNGGAIGAGDGAGYEESKGNEHGNGFADSAAEPLLGVAGAINGGGHAVAGGDGRDGEGERVVPKKGTGVHWLKLLLYWLQVFYYLSVGCYDLVDGHADDPYKCESERKT